MTDLTAVTGNCTFINGELIPIEAPDWFRALPLGDSQAAMREAGCNLIETFGDEGDDIINIWRQRGGGWVIEYDDSFRSVMTAFIDLPLDYVLFRVKILAPLVTLMEAAQARFAREDDAREL